MTQHELQAIIQSGEGYKFEFKRSVNSDLARELVAFANSSGGKVLIGVEDNGTIAGIVIDNKLHSEIQMTANNCDPSVTVEISNINDVLVIDVPEGKNKPYRCSTGFYIRTGSSSVKLGTDEIISFIKTEGRVKFDELQNTTVNYPDSLNESKVKKYISLAGIDASIDHEQLLINLGILHIEKEGPIINNAGVLFFTQNPAFYIPQSIVTCVSYKGSSKVDILDKKSFEFDMITNIDESITFVKRHLNLNYEITGKQRSEKLEIPEVVLREAIVNAVAHRDYFEKGATVMVEVFDNRVEISNPGGLPKGLTPNDFGTRTLARNPLIASLLQRARYIEKLGTGVPRIRKCMVQAGLPEPIFHFNTFFTVTLKRYHFRELLKRQLKLNDKRSDRVALIIRSLAEPVSFKVENIAQEMATTSRTIRNDLDFLIEHGWIRSSGATKGKEYELTELANQQLVRFG